MIFKKHRGKKGFLRGAVLLEILLALGVLSISLGLIIQTLAASLRAVDYSADLLRAIFLWETKMCGLAGEKVVARGFSLEEDAPAPFEGYRYQITARDVFNEESPAKEIQQVDLRVAWDAGQRQNELTASTFFLTGKDK